MLAASKAEMGQGILTATATLVAEELEVDISKLTVYQAHKEEFGFQITGGSGSTKPYLPLRRAAATAREMLRAAAAEEWGVALEECHAKQGPSIMVRKDCHICFSLQSAALQEFNESFPQTGKIL